MERKYSMKIIIPKGLIRNYSAIVIVVVLLFCIWAIVTSVVQVADQPLTQERIVAQEVRVNQQALTLVKETFLQPQQQPAMTVRNPFIVP
jgi:hypothetical protein